MADKRKQPGYNPKQTGEISESQILATFLRGGKVVLTPFGDSQRYDLVVDEGGDFIRVQCKTGSLTKTKDRIRFPCCSSNWNTNVRKTYKGDADVFAVYCPDLDEVYVVSVENAPTKVGTLRLTKHNMARNQRMAADHLFHPDRSLRDYP